MSAPTESTAVAVQTGEPGAVAATGHATAIVAAGGAESLTQLLFMAVERGTQVAELRELVALHDQVSRREAAQAFARALAAFQATCPPIAKNKRVSITTRRGGEYGYSYAELDAIARTIAPFLAEQGLSYTWDTTLEGASIRVVCTLSHVAGHSAQSSFTLPVANDNPGMSPQQKVGAAMTFAQRRTLCAVLGITTSESEEPPEEAKSRAAGPITEEQAGELLDLINEKRRGRKDEARFLDRFLETYAIEAVDQLPVTQYEHALRTLNELPTKVPAGATS